MNQYPLWKNIMILVIVLIGALYALPNIYDQNPSIEITASRDKTVDQALHDTVKARLDSQQVNYKKIQFLQDKIRIRFSTPDDQLRGQEALTGSIPDGYTQALTLLPDLPAWLVDLGAEPMYLGLDLRGGIHVLIDVDMDAAVKQAIERYTGDVRSFLRREKLRYITVRQTADGIEVKFNDAELRDTAEEKLGNEFRDLTLDASDEEGAFFVRLSLSEDEQRGVKKFALDQNITTLRNRVNALGVAEPIIQQQGDRRIVVQLPGAQDPGRLKELLGATATLEYRLVDTDHSVQDAVEGRVPAGAKLYRERDGTPVLLKKRVIVTGNQITDASSGLDQRSGAAAVFVNLDGQGARRMRNVTTDNVGKPMAVVFI
ncbi:MAG: protein translocase subunit SecD, partial [Gammaproteobacteria bacterium]